MALAEEPGRAAARLLVVDDDDLGDVVRIGSVYSGPRMIIFNLPGIAMLIVGALVAFGGGNLLGIHAEPPLMIAFGLLVGPMDVAYRLHLASAEAPRRASLVTRARAMGFEWIRPSAGGSLFFLPLWVFGVVWIVLGVVRMVRGH